MCKDLFKFVKIISVSGKIYKGIITDITEEYMILDATTKILKTEIQTIIATY